MREIESEIGSKIAHLARVAIIVIIIFTHLELLITLLMISASSFAVTDAKLTHSAIPLCFATLAFRGWSPKKGAISIGTP